MPLIKEGGMIKDNILIILHSTKNYYENHIYNTEVPTSNSSKIISVITTFHDYQILSLKHYKHQKLLSDNFNIPPEVAEIGLS